MHTNSKYWKFDYVISKHIDAVRDFTLHNIPECKTNPAKPYKIAIQCPFCGDSRKRYKLVINLDDGYYKCFRCGRTGGLLGIYNEFGVRNEFINLHYYHNDDELNQAVSEFAYIWYNHVRPQQAPPFFINPVRQREEILRQKRLFGRKKRETISDFPLHSSAKEQIKIFCNLIHLLKISII